MPIDLGPCTSEQIRYEYEILLAWILHIDKYNLVDDRSKFVITIARYRRDTPAASALYV
jgi:hypothetical protein